MAHALYSRFPIFGAIRGSLAIIRRDGGFVVIERNDGHGLGFPGGMSHFREDPEHTVRREVFEETGLKISTAEFRFNYRTTKPIPTFTFVYEATAEGELHSSWEGTAKIASLDELKARVVPRQQQLVDYIDKHA